MNNPILPKSDGLPGGRAWWHGLWRYAVAIAAVGVAVAVRWALDSLWCGGFTFVTFYPALAIAGMLAGGRAGLLATGLSAVAADVMFLEPRGYLGQNRPGDWVALGLFVGAGALMSWMAGMLGRARKREWLAAEREKAAEGLRRGKELSEAVNRISQVLHSTLETDEVIERIVEEGVAALGSDTAAISERKGGGWLVRYVHGLPGELVGQQLEDEQERHAVLAIETREVVPVADCFNDHRFNREHLRRYNLRSVLVAPLIMRGEPFGAIFFNYHKAPHAFSEAEVNFARQLASSAAVALENARLFEERKRAEEALHQAHQRLQYHNQNTPLAVIEFDADLRVSAWSDEARRVFGWEASEVLGRPMFDIPWIIDEDRPGIERVAAGMCSGQTRRSVSPNRNVRKDGKVIWCEWYNSSLTDGSGKMQSIQSLVLDVTERKKAEEAVREKERQFRTLADSIPNLAWWANGDGYITWYNRRWFEYTGTTPEQMEGWGWQSVHDPAVLPKVLEQWRSCVADGEPFEMEFPLRGADGKFRWFLTRGIPLKDALGRVTRWFGTNTDVTEARDAREVLARSNEKLEQLVVERTARLQELVGELEHFSYTITHDMRSPLRAMKGFSEMVNLACADCERKEPKELLRRVSSSAERMDRLIIDALNYSRSVRQELPLEDVDTGELLRGMLDTYPEFQSSKANIQIEGELPLVLGNEAGLTQCFSNLLGNAVKFVKPGQVPEIRIWAEPVKSEIQNPKSEHLAVGHNPKPAVRRPKSESEWVRIWVEDDGIGISREMLPRVFDMFSRGSKSYEGTGIGLALVRKMAQRMGGRAGVESEEGKGSRFWLELRAGEQFVGSLF
jgi:PAS domain S-box-containing protein